MKKVIKLSEEKLERIVNLVLEQVNLNDYEEEDFYDAYFSTFRQWIVEKLGEDINPDFVSVNFQEDQPNRVRVRFDVDFEKMIKSQERYSLSSHTLLDKIKKYLKNFLGVEFGNPAYGEVDMESDKTNYVGLDEWVKNVLNKKIKKEIKALLKPNPIHAIRFEVNNGKATMKIVFSDSAGFGTRGNTMKEIRSYLEKEGYNPRVFEVEY